MLLGEADRELEGEAEGDRDGDGDELADGDDEADGSAAGSICAINRSVRLPPGTPFQFDVKAMNSPSRLTFARGVCQ